METLTILGHYPTNKFLPDLNLDIGDVDRQLYFFYHLILKSKKKLDKQWPTKAEFKKWLKVYLVNYINDRLLNNSGRNLLNFTNQKKGFLALMGNYYNKYGDNFSIEYISPEDEESDDGFLFVHTMFALEHLGYLKFERLNRAKKDEKKMGKYWASSNVGYQCKIFLKEKIIEEIRMSRIKQDGDNAKITIIKTKNGILKVNKLTGDVYLNSYSTTLNLTSKPFRTLVCLIESTDYLATYKQLLLGDSESKSNKRTLSFYIRDLKTALSILPKGKNKNKDIIKNVKNYGYKIITE